MSCSPGSLSHGASLLRGPRPQPRHVDHRHPGSSGASQLSLSDEPWRKSAACLPPVLCRLKENGLTAPAHRDPRSHQEANEPRCQPGADFAPALTSPSCSRPALESPAPLPAASLQMPEHPAASLPPPLRADVPPRSGPRRLFSLRTLPCPSLPRGCREPLVPTPASSTLTPALDLSLESPSIRWTTYSAVPHALHWAHCRTHQKVPPPAFTRSLW